MSEKQPKLSCDEMSELIVILVLLLNAEDFETMQPGMRAAVENHLDGCRSCRRKRESLIAALGTTSLDMTTDQAWAVLKATAASEQRQAALLCKHARLMNAGFPEPETGEFLSEVAELPEEDKAHLKELCGVSEALKRALCSEGGDDVRSPFES